MPWRVCAIFNGLINFCWSIFKWVVLIGILGAAVAVLYLDRQIDEQIRRRVEEKLAEHYGDLEVTVRAAELVEGEGVEVRGVSIVEPGAEGPRAELLYVEEILLTCRTDLKELIACDPDVHRVAIRRATLRPTLRRDGSWSAAKLLPLPRFSEYPPELIVENGTVEVFDPLKSPSGTFTLRDVDLTLSPPAVDSSSGGFHPRRLHGTLGGDYLRQMRFEGSVDPEDFRWNLIGSVDQLEFAPELRDVLPSPLAAKLAALGGFRGQGNLSFRLNYEPARKTALQFDITGQVLRGRVDDPRLPHPLSDIRGRFHLDNAGFRVDDLLARSNQTAIRLSCRRAGYQDDSPLQLSAEIRQLELDGRLADALPVALHSRWYKYLPAGQIDADVKLAFDGSTWIPELSVRCINVSFAYEKFPYRLENGSGTLELKNDLFTAHLTVYSGNRPVRISAEVRQPLSAPFGWVEATGDGIELDAKLLGALPAKLRRVVRSLDPRGTANFYFRAWRDGPNGTLRRHLIADLNRCSICYSKFPYPLNNVRGRIEMLDKRWTFSGLDGTNDTGYVTCEGEMVPTTGGSRLTLRFTGTSVPLEEELRDALRPGLQRLWNSLRPQGAVDLSGELTYLSEEDRLSVGFRAEPREETSIESVAFPYKLEKLRGTLSYRDGAVTLHRVRAQHGDTTLSCNGTCRFVSDGGWLMHLEDLSVDRLRMDRELIQALPGRLKKGVLELNATGPVNLRGMIDFSRSGEPDAPLTSEWDLQVNLHRASIDCGLKLENIYGGLRLAGQHDGRHYFSRGELSIDSFTWHDVQFTQLLGPIWIDDQRILLGTWVDRPPAPQISGSSEPSKSAPRPLTAELFGGTATASAWIALAEIPHYGAHVELSAAELGEAARDMVPGRQNLRGKVWASADLRGAGRNTSTLGGRGRLALRDADIYELPLIVALLKILRIQEPDTNAFRSCDLKFRVEGNHIYFDPIHLSGDAISLEGAGEMDFQTAIRLTFRAMLGPTEERLPIIGDLLGGASEQIMLVRVGGTLQAPEVSKEAFPGVNQALQQLQGDLQENRQSGPAGAWRAFPQSGHSGAARN